MFREAGAGETINATQTEKKQASCHTLRKPELYWPHKTGSYRIFQADYLMRCDIAPGRVILRPRAVILPGNYLMLRRYRVR